MDDKLPITIQMGEGQTAMTLLQGKAPALLDEKPPVKINLQGTIYAPLAFLEKRINDIDQHHAHIIVNRDNLTIKLVICENDEYRHGEIVGCVSYSEIFTKLGINSDKCWPPEVLGRFLKLNRSFFADRDEGMKVVSALKKFDAKVEQAMSRQREENGNVGLAFKQSVINSNIPEHFTLRIPIFSGGEREAIEVETFANIDGANVTICLQSAGANEIIEECKSNGISDVVAAIRQIAPEIAIIEQ